MKTLKTIAGLAFSVLLPVILFLVIFKEPGITQGYNTILVSDLNGQYINYFLYFKDAILRGDNLFYSFSILLGGDTLGMLGYYLLSPLNFILLLFPTAKMATGIFTIITIKVGLMGLTSYMYFTRKRGPRFSSLIFSTTYALSGYVFAYFMNVMWLDALYLLPLVIMGLELMVEKKNRSLYIITFALSIIFCYYTGYMIAGFSVLYFIYLQIREQYKAKRRFGSIFTFLWTSLLAVAISAFALVPILISHIGNRLAQEGIEYGVLHSFAEVLSKFFTSAYDSAEFANGAPQIYCGVLVLFLVVLYFVTVKVTTRKKIAAGVLLVLLLASFSIGSLDILWHGMATPNSFSHRYAFVFVFALLVIAEECFANIRLEIKLPDIIITNIIVFMLIGFLWWTKLEYVSNDMLIFDAIIVLAISLLFYFYKNGKKEYCLHMLCFFAFIQMLQLFTNADTYVGIHTYDDNSTIAYYSAITPVVDEVKKEDDGFYRMEKVYFNSQNDAMMLSYNGLSHFSSTDKSFVRSFLGNLGYNKNYDFWAYYDKGATLAGDSLLGVKYILSTESINGLNKIDTVEQNIIHENPYALAIGTVSSYAIKMVEIKEEKVFENQQMIYDALCDTDTDLFIKYDVTTTLNNINNEDNSYIKINKDSDGIIRFEFVAKDSNPVYMYLPSEYNPDVAVYVNGDYKSDYLNAYHRGIIELGRFEEGTPVLVDMYLKGNHAGFNSVQIYGLDLNKLEEVTDTLQDQAWDVKEHNSGYIKAEFDVTEDNSVLFITIPYSENWKITVDGVPVKATEVLGALMAVDVSKGTHVIEMRYEPFGILQAGIVSGVALLLFVVVFVFDCVNTHKRKAELAEKRAQAAKAAKKKAGKKPEKSVDGAKKENKKAKKPVDNAVEKNEEVKQPEIPLDPVTTDNQEETAVETAITESQEYEYTSEVENTQYDASTESIEAEDEEYSDSLEILTSEDDEDEFEETTSDVEFEENDDFDEDEEYDDEVDDDADDDDDDEEENTISDSVAVAAVATTVVAKSTESSANNTQQQANYSGYNANIPKAEDNDSIIDFFQKQYNCACQVCERTITDRYGKIAWHTAELFEDIEIDEDEERVIWDKICVCPFCKTEFEYADISMDNFISDAANRELSGMENSYRFGINVQNQEKNIVYSLIHLRYLQDAIDDYGEDVLNEKLKHK